MPLFKALAACPDRDVIRPDLVKYSEVGRTLRAEMLRLTPFAERCRSTGISRTRRPGKAPRCMPGAAPRFTRRADCGQACDHRVDRAERRQVPRQASL